MSLFVSAAFELHLSHICCFNGVNEMDHFLVSFSLWLVVQFHYFTRHHRTLYMYIPDSELILLKWILRFSHQPKHFRSDWKPFSGNTFSFEIWHYVGRSSQACFIYRKHSHSKLKLSYLFAISNVFTHTHTCLVYGGVRGKFHSLIRLTICEHTIVNMFSIAIWMRFVADNFIFIS